MYKLKFIIKVKLLNRIKLIWGESKYIFSFLQNYCTPPKCGELSEYTDSAHIEVDDLSSRCMNESNEHD